MNEFVDLLAAKTPAPGGGGASALCGALAAALGSMVGNFTAGKPKYAAVEEDIQRLLVEGEELRAALMDCIARDAEAFEPLSRAYGIPMGDPSRETELESCLHAAASVPMEILRLCCRAVELLEEYGEKGSVMMLSDVGTGAAIARSALGGAAVNVRVNTKLMRDRAYAEALEREVDELLGEYGDRAARLFENVYARYC